MNKVDILPRLYPKCKSTLSSNGIIMWCDNGHVWEIVDPPGEV
jgi:hypothetical protein